MEKKVLCFGDSITKGHPGVTYLDHLQNKVNYINHGLSGDTLMGMTDRLIKRLESDDIDEVEGIIVGIGANDIIQPFIKEYSWMWKQRSKLLLRRGSVPCRDEEHFRQEYIKMIEILKSTNKKILIFSMPYLENYNYNLNKTIKKYNRFIQRTCRVHDIPYVDYYSWQDKTRRKMKNKNYAFMSKNPFAVGLDTLLTTHLRLADFVSSKRNLGLTMDGCHLNNFASKSLATMIEEKYKEIE